jgi:amino acid adenylation domain-containing protein
LPFFPFGFEYYRQPNIVPLCSLFSPNEHHYSWEDRFNFKLACIDRGRSIQLEFGYDSTRYEESDLQRVAERFEAILNRMPDHLDEPLEAIELVGPKECHELLVDFNQSGRNYSHGPFAHELFEKHVEDAGDRTALECDGAHVSFAELNRRANQLARFLRREGIGPETPVGICMERCHETIVCVLAILKAGGAYVPLDPAYPQQRLEFMLTDSRASLLLTHSRIASVLGPLAARTVCIDSDWRERVHGLPENIPPPSISSDTPAYILYTSGSTGQPKGVVVCHGALRNHMQWMQDTFPLTDADRVLQRTQLSFDASVWEIQAPLLAGATLVLTPDGNLDDPEAFVELLVRQRLTILQLVPSLLRRLLEEKQLDSCRSLRRLFCGGEQLTPELAARVMARLDLTLCNLYGPTEACIDATYWTHPKSSERRRSIPIGRPISNVTSYVLDPRLRPVPLGITGELYLGGLGLARGYFRRADLTAERFVPFPFPEEPGGRLYKTGDLVWYLPSGILEFCGRQDHQVKVRGFRIELAELDSALQTYPSLLQAVTVPHLDRSGDAYLVAYYVADEEFSASELRQHLERQLPAHLIPSAFVRMEKLPLTPNGKVDRQRLPKPHGATSRAGKPYEAPRTETERKLTQLWAELLQVERVGIRDNFFELGGHSLLVTRVISRLRKEFHVELNQRSLFESPTVTAMAKRLDNLLQVTTRPRSEAGASGPREEGEI